MGKELPNLGSAIPDHITLSWTLDPTTTMTITWRTDDQTMHSLVQYAPYNGMDITLPQRAASVNGTVYTYTSNMGVMNIHCATLTHLQPGTKYLYQVGDGNNWSNVYSFRTPSLYFDKFRAVIFSDTQSGAKRRYNYETWRQVLTSAVTREDPDFVVINGDLVEVGHDQKHWEAWYDTLKDTMEYVPLIPVVGNHETHAPHTSRRKKPTFFTAQFNLPDNGPAGLKGQVYSFDYGPVHFVVLDSQGKEEGSLILKTQQNWLGRDLKATQLPWKIAFFHKAIYSVKVKEPSRHVKDAFCPVLEKHHVDLVINGHTHAVSRAYPIFKKTVTRRPSKGTVYVGVGASGTKKRKTKVRAKSWTESFYNPRGKPTYLLLQVNGSLLQLITKKADGTIIDSFIIDKATDTYSTNNMLPDKE